MSERDRAAARLFLAELQGVALADKGRDFTMSFAAGLGAAGIKSTEDLILYDDECFNHAATAALSVAKRDALLHAIAAGCSAATPIPEDAESKLLLSKLIKRCQTAYRGAVESASNRAGTPSALDGPALTASEAAHAATKAYAELAATQGALIDARLRWSPNRVAQLNRQAANGSALSALADHSIGVIAVPRVAGDKTEVPGVMRIGDFEVSPAGTLKTSERTALRFTQSVVNLEIVLAGIAAALCVECAPQLNPNPRQGWGMGGGPGAS